MLPSTGVENMKNIDKIKFKSHKTIVLNCKNIVRNYVFSVETILQNLIFYSLLMCIWVIWNVFVTRTLSRAIISTLPIQNRMAHRSQENCISNLRLYFVYTI